MTVRAVLKMGHPLLRQVAAPVAVFDAAQLHELLTDMEDTMRALNGAGIAAPQIGVSPFTVLINPVLEPLGTEREEGWEGCLSVPGLRGVVPRYRRLHYRGLDRDGQVFERTVEGFHARVVQHEVDHLDGVLFPQRVEDMTRFGFEDALVGQMVPTPD
jgi:peptide deformylase